MLKFSDAIGKISEKYLNITRQTMNKSCLPVKVNLWTYSAECKHVKRHQEYLGGLGNGNKLCCCLLKLELGEWEIFRWRKNRVSSAGRWESIPFPGMLGGEWDEKEMVEIKRN